MARRWPPVRLCRAPVPRTVLRRDRSADSFAAQLYGEPDHPPSAEEAMITAERESQVRAAFRRLSQEQAMIARLGSRLK